MITQGEIENIEIRNVLIFDKDDACDLYMEHLFPLWTDVVLVSLEGKYPIDQRLKDRVFSELENNPNLFVVQFGYHSENFKVASNKKFKMSYFLLRDLVMYDRHHPEFNFNAESIISVLMSLTESPLAVSNIRRPQIYNHVIDSAVDDSKKWYHNLLRS
jgi:hypothetical protein